MADANIIVIGGNADDQDHDIPGNTNPAWRVHQGSEDYIAISTVTGSEAILLATGTGIDDYDGCKVGVSITSPQDKLHVATQDSEQAYVRFTNDTTGHASGDGCYVGLNSDETMRIWHKEASVIAFGTSNAEAMRIDADGNVGIGTTSPGAKLEVAGASNADNQELFCITEGVNDRFKIIGDFNTAGNPFHICGESVEAITILSNGSDAGNVGIGTTNPATKLDVKRTDGSVHDAVVLGQFESTVGNTQLKVTGKGTETNGAYGLGRWGAGAVFVNSDDTVGNYTGFQNVNADGYGNCGINFVNKAHGTTTTEGEIAFHTRASGGGYAEAVRFDCDGNVGIGDATPSKMLDIKNGASGGDILCYDIYTHDGGVHTSDERKKENITPSALGLDFINALNPVSYKWRDTEHVIPAVTRIDSEGVETVTEERTEKTEYIRTHYGLIAQEVLGVLDDAGVGAEGFGGYCYEDDRDQHGLRYNEFISPLIKAVQELSAQIKELKEGK